MYNPNARYISSEGSIMKDTVIEVLKGFGDDKEINESSLAMDDLGGDEFDILDVIVQVESELGISI